MGEISLTQPFRHRPRIQNATREPDETQDDQPGKITLADIPALLLCGAQDDHDTAGRAAELVDRAFQWAHAGRPGPVIVGLPEDVLGEVCESRPQPPSAPPAQGLDPATLASMADELRRASRPLVWVGGGGWSDADRAALQEFAHAWQLPVATAFRRKDLFSNADRSYAGELGFGANPRLVQRVRDADRILVLGAPLGDVETGGYQWLERTTTAGKLLQVHPDGETLGAVFPVLLAAQAPPGAAAAALRSLAPAADAQPWSAWTRAARADQEAFMAPVGVVGDVNLSELFRQLRASVPDTAIVTNGAGNYAAWLHRFYSHDRGRTQLAPGSGAMGYAVPAAIAAKIALPEREVVCVAGDGCFLMASQELATAAGRGLKILFLVVNNGAYGTIRMHQEARFPGRTVGTDLANPDFVALAAAYGLGAWRVAATADFAPALAAARAHSGPALIEIVTSIEDIAPGRRLTTR